MKLAIIGYGNLGWHLTNQVSKLSNIDISVYSRSEKKLPDKVHRLADFKAINDSFDVIFCAVNDNSISKVSQALFNTGIKDSLVVHSSGAGKIELLNPHIRKAVFWPLMSLKAGVDLNWSNVPIFVSGNSIEDTGSMLQLAQAISNTVLEVTDLERLKYHMAAVVSNNFSNYCISKAYSLLEESNLKPDVLRPILLQQIKALASNHPKDLQTGPAIRNDQSTLNEHRKLLEENELDFYNFLSNCIAEN